MDLQKLEFYFQRLEKTAGEQIRTLYNTACARCGADPVDGLHAFWVRYVGCPYCNQRVDLFKRTLLNEGLSRNKPVSETNPATTFCPRCNALTHWKGQDTCKCEDCGSVFNPREGSYTDGYFDCPHCKRHHVSLIKAIRGGKRLREKLVAIEYWCPNCNERLYKSPDSKDSAKIKGIVETFSQWKDRLILPRQPILEGASSVRWRQHKYRFYYEIFSPRQLSAFNCLFQAIRQIPEEEYRNAFITIFSNSLEYNNMMTPYNYPHRKLHHLFNYHALPLTTTPVENSVWGTGVEGAGTFANCYRRYAKAKEYCQKPYDMFKEANGQITTKYAEEEKIGARLVKSFDELLRTPRSALLLCRDSSLLPEIPDKSVDIVLTDPPYFDNIHYSELSNFFYVWLRSLVNDPHFAAENVPTEREAIVNPGMDKGDEQYEQLLTSVFAEAHRVLKDAGRLIFTFHHSKWRAWWTVLRAIVGSNLHLSDFFPAMTEYKVSPHVRNKQALDTDLVLICVKRLGDHTIPSLDPKEILARAMTCSPDTWENGSKNRLFLYFMGELLQTASAAWETRKITWDWFCQSLTHFDSLLAARQTPYKEEELLTGQVSTTRRHAPAATQVIMYPQARA